MFHQLNRIGGIALLLVSSLLARTSEAACSAREERNACPLKVGGAVVFDRCFLAPPAGPDAGKPTRPAMFACDAVRDTSLAVERLGKSANGALNQSQRDWNDFVKVTLDDAIDRDAIRQVQSALSVGKELEADVRSLLEDRECGTRAALGNLERKLNETVGVVRDAGAVAGLSLQAVDKLRPAAAELGVVVAELQRLAQTVGQKGSKADQELQKLQKAAVALQGELQKLLAADFAGVASAGGNLVTGVGPFLATCSGCATALGVAVQSLATGTTVTAGGGAACPETGGIGCALAAVGLPSGAVASALASAVASAPCASATAGLTQMERHLDTIRAFVDGMAKLTVSIPNAITQATLAGQALAQLANELGGEAQASLGIVRASLERIQPALAAAGAIVQKQIAPKVARMGAGFVSTFGKDTALLDRCHGKLELLTANLGSEVYAAMALLAEGSLAAVDGGKIVSNLQTQSTAGLNAAKAFTDRKWRQLDADYRDIHRALWGVPPDKFDLAKSVAHLADLARQPDKVGNIAKDAGELVAAQAALATGALDAGKQAFLGRDRATTQAREKYAVAKAKAKDAQARLEAMRSKAKATTGKQVEKRALLVRQLSSSPALSGAELRRPSALGD